MLAIRTLKDLSVSKNILGLQLQLAEVLNPFVTQNLVEMWGEWKQSRAILDSRTKYNDERYSSH